MVVGKIPADQPFVKCLKSLNVPQESTHSHAVLTSAGRLNRVYRVYRVMPKCNNILSAEWLSKHLYK